MVKLWFIGMLTVKEVSKSIWAGASPSHCALKLGDEGLGKKNIWSGHLKLIPPLIGGFPKERVFCSGIASLTWVLESMRCHLRLQTLRCSLLSARGLKRIQRRISFCCCLWNSEALVVTKWKNLEHSQKQPSIHIPTPTQTYTQSKWSVCWGSICSILQGIHKGHPMADAKLDNQASAGDRRVSRNPYRSTTTAAQNNTPQI